MVSSVEIGEEREKEEEKKVGREQNEEEKLQYNQMCHMKEREEA